MSDSRTIAEQQRAFLAHIGARTRRSGALSHLPSDPPPSSPPRQLTLVRQHAWVPPPPPARPIELEQHVNPLAREAALAGVRRPGEIKQRKAKEKLALTLVAARKGKLPSSRIKRHIASFLGGRKRRRTKRRRKKRRRKSRRHPHKRQRSKTRKGRLDFVTHKGDKAYNARSRRQYRKRRPYSRRRR